MTRFSDADDYMNLFVGTDTDEIGDTYQSLGTGDDSAVTFSGTASVTPVLAYSVKVVADTIVATDDGNGVLSGSGVVSGSIDYSTGAVSITFTTAPASSVDVALWFRDTTDKLYGISLTTEELDRGTKTVTVSVEQSQTLSDIFADGDTVHFIDNSTGQKLAKATIATGGVGASAITIVEDIPASVTLNGSYLANSIFNDDLAAGASFSIWVKQIVPQYCSAYSNSYFGINSIFASS